MPRPINITLDGVRYSFKKACRVAHISPKTVRDIVQSSSNTHEDIVQHAYANWINGKSASTRIDLAHPEPKRCLSAPPYRIGDVVLDSFEKVANAMGVSVETYASRVKTRFNWDVQTAINFEMSKKRVTRFTYNGESCANAMFVPFCRYVQLKEVAAAEGVSDYTLRARATDGCDINSICVRIKEEQENAEKEKELYVADGIQFSSAMQMCSYLGVNPTSFSQYKEKYGLTTAIEHYVEQLHTKREPLWVNEGIEYFTERSIALFFGVLPTSFYEYSNKHGLQAAIEHYQTRTDIERYTVAGKSGIGIKEAAELAHTAATTLRKRSEETGLSIQSLLDEAYDKWLKDPPPYWVDGVSYQTRTEVARALGLGKNAILKKCKEGMTTAEAIIYFQERAKNESLVAERKAIAESIGITVELYQSMLDRLGSIDSIKAFIAKYPKMFTGKAPSTWYLAPDTECQIRGERYYRHEDIANAIGITKVALSSWLYENRNGRTMQLCVDELLLREDEMDRGPWDIDGKRCVTYAECAEALGTTRAAFGAQVSGRGSVEAAIAYYKSEDYRTSARALANLQVEAHSIKTLYKGRDGRQYYTATCASCLRKLVMLYEDLENFKHSDLFCPEHEL